jgi:5-methylcytosine-specific restriction endonuclease McrA
MAHQKRTPEQLEKHRLRQAKYRANNLDKCRESVRKNRENNPERTKELSAKYRAERPEVYKMARLKWEMSNKEYLKKYRKNRYENNKEKDLALSREWKKNNKDRDRETKAAWAVRNKEKIKGYRSTPESLIKRRAWASAWAAANPEKRKELLRRFNENNPEASRIYKQNRYARKKYNGGKLSTDLPIRLLELQHNKCVVCKKDFKKTGYQLDHIIPLARGGKNIDSNIQLLCPKCNLKKHAKDPIQFMREMGYLL